MTIEASTLDRMDGLVDEYHDVLFALDHAKEGGETNRLNKRMRQLEQRLLTLFLNNAPAFIAVARAHSLQDAN